MIDLASYLRANVRPLFLIAFILSVGVVSARASNAASPPSQVRIAQDLELIRGAENRHLSAAQQGALWEQLALDYHAATQFSKAEDAYNRALHLLKTAPSARTEYASVLDDLASLYLIYGRLEDAESARKQALKVRRELGDPTGITISEGHLADIALARRQFKKAERQALQGLEGIESSPNPPRSAVLSALITLTYARCLRGRCGEGLINAKQCVVFANKHFESESAANGFALETLGFAEWKSGALPDGEIAMRRAIQILGTTLAPADPRLAGAMLQYRAYLIEVNRQAEAQGISEQITRMTRQAGVFCPGCAVSVYSLSKTLR